MGDPNSHGQKPLQGLVICCTHLTQDVRTNVAQAAEEMGAVHKLDLTGDVTHLICGSISTPKYQYTAKFRPDIVVLHPDWLETVRQAWIAGDEVDIPASERQYRLPTFFGLKACLTGFTDMVERERFKDTFERDGAEYHGDLTKQVTHLIAHTASGAKYQHAIQWKIQVVTTKWVQDSLRRGMALDESLYHPSMPQEEQGQGAFKTHVVPRTSLGKRTRDAEGVVSAGQDASRRKLRRSASTRLNADSQDVWHGMTGREETSAAPDTDDQWRDVANPGESDEDNASTRNSILADRIEPTELLEVPAEPQGLFAGSYVLMHGFNHDRKKRLAEYLTPNGATVVQSSLDLDTAMSKPFHQNNYILIPHTAAPKLPTVPAGTLVVSQWWLERCLQQRIVYAPETDALSRPFPAGPIPGFEELIINTTGFSSVDLRQSAEAIKLVGARYEANFGSCVSVLLSGSTTVKYEKSQYAAKHDIPTLRADWLYDCLKTRSRLPFHDYRIALAPYASCQTCTPAPGETISDKPRESFKADEAQPQRLSNLRKKHPTSSLSLQAPTPTAVSAAVSCQKGPFVLEDDEDGHDEPLVPETLHVTTSDPQSLKERSPNASPRKSTLPASLDERALEDKPSRGMTLAQPDPKVDPKILDSALDLQPSSIPSLARPAEDLAADLARVISQSAQSRAREGTASGPPPTRRKNRPLGRNLSGSNTRSTVSEDVTSQPEPPPPATQIEYETVDAKAHRLQMEKRLKNDLGDPATGLHGVVSVGTVKDIGQTTGKRSKERLRVR